MAPITASLHIAGADAERATIVEHHVEFVPPWAEGLGRLNPGRPLGDVPEGRWRTFIDDCARFSNGNFAAMAVVLGWGNRLRLVAARFAFAFGVNRKQIGRKTKARLVPISSLYLTGLWRF